MSAEGGTAVAAVVLEWSLATHGIGSLVGVTSQYLTDHATRRHYEYRANGLSLALVNLTVS